MREQKRREFIWCGAVVTNWGFIGSKIITYRYGGEMNSTLMQIQHA